MRQAVKTHLPSERVPIEWATTADGILYTAQIPIREDGSIETGDITKQATLTLDNLKRTVEAAGGSMDDVTQVLVYLTSPDAFPGMNAVYEKYFRKPYPNRATLVAGLMVKGALIEIVAYAHIGKGKH
ncbi:MAG TPA: RidA family protein [Stellaceae bacterium]|jgi:enamine deaminase RidA (YjgF/YER057c/UK114 family)|nr:RidA family protein [Stellaceae bacterium]